MIDADCRLKGVITRKDLAEPGSNRNSIFDIARPKPVVALADESLRTVVYRMAEAGFTRLPVVDSEVERKLVGMLSLDDLLHARARNLSEERSRERVLRIRLPFREARKAAPVQE